MELLEIWEHSLNGFVMVAKLALETISVFCVVLGLLKTIQLTFRLRQRRQRGEDFPFNQLRLKFGTWLALALEFQLAADILATTVAPTMEDLGKLVIVAIVRTFLNYFLNKELEAEMEQERQKQLQEA
ncbi:MAG: DUF1622 domain-containing protein [Cyanobacteria bacterium P01_D01_bin.115]